MTKNMLTNEIFPIDLLYLSSIKISIPVTSSQGQS